MRQRVARSKTWAHQILLSAADAVSRLQRIARSKTWARLAVVLGVGLFTQSAYAYRTGADTGQFGDTPKVRWVADRVGYQLHENAPEYLEPSEVARVVAQALGTWSEPSCSALAFAADGTTTAAAAPQDGVNSVSWITAGWSDRGWSTSAAGLTDLLYETDADGAWHIVEGDIYLNAEDNTWILEGESTGQRDLLSVVVHEGGHLLGLMHPCEPDGADGAPDCENSADYQRASMYPFYDAGQASLDDDDAAGLCFLYGDNDCTENSCPEGQVCEAGQCVVACQGSVCGDKERCTPAGCWPKGKCWGIECADPECETNNDCDASHTCSNGRCLGSAVLGDPCTTAGECADGACSTDGTCARVCVIDEQCNDGDSCKPSLSKGIGACIGKLGGMGDACDDERDCLGAQCLEGAAAHPICTRGCGGDLPYCPTGWDCDAVQASPVCRPASALVQACSLSRREQKPSTALACVTALIVFLAAARRSKRAAT